MLLFTVRINGGGDGMCRKWIALLLCIMLLPSGVAGYTANASPAIEIPFSVQEQNDIAVGKTLIRRGFPLAEGDAASLEGFGVYDIEGNYIPSVFEVTEKYPSGSVKWALCSFVTDLRAGERKELVISNRGRKKIENPVLLTQPQPGEYVVQGGNVSAVINHNGIEELKYGDIPYACMNTYVTLTGGAEQMLSITSLEVVKHNDLYVKLKAGGMFGDYATGEIIFTLWSGAPKADIEYRITSVADINIYSMGMKISPLIHAQFTSPSCDYGDGQIVGSDYITESVNGNSAYFISNDIRRFRNAIAGEDSTGFVFEDNHVKFAPIIHNQNFLWYDGLTRTNHMTVSFEENGADQIKTVEEPPVVMIDTDQFVKAGVIANDERCEPIDRMINLIHWDYDKRDGRLDAGAINYGIDPETNHIGITDAHPGEMEYHYGVAYMATGDYMIYNTIMQSAEFWADVEIYKGQYEVIYGANRYRTGPQYSTYRFRTSHPYYGDSSGLYMAYVLSGNEYLRDTFKIAIEHIYKNMYASKNMGHFYPHMYQWDSGEPRRLAYVESRYMIQARPLYLAYGLFGDASYREAALEIANWADAAQSADGWWYQAYHDGSGDPFYQGGQTQAAVKTYVWMYGARGISFLSRYEQNDTIKRILKKIGDFVASEYETYGAGLWNPTGDKNLYEMNEDNSRSKGAYEDIMAVELLLNTYRLTGDNRHLKALLTAVDVWLCSMNPQGSTVILANLEGYLDGTFSMGGGQNYTMLMVYPELLKLFSEKAQIIKELGFAYLLKVFDKNTHAYTKTVEKPGIVEPEVTQGIYVNGDTKYLFAKNYTGARSGNFEKDYTTVIYDAGLWQGVENRVSNPYATTLYAHLKQYDDIHAVWRPIYITGLSDDVTAYVDQYDADKIVFRLYGSGVVNVQIKDGEFAIAANEKYSVRASRDGNNGVIVTVCRHCDNNTLAGQDGLSFKVTLSRYIEIKDSSSVSTYSVVSKGLMPLYDGQFFPDEKADKKEFSSAAAKISGTNTSFSGNTYQDAARYVLSLIAEKNEPLFEKAGIIVKPVTVIGSDISDEQAVQYGADMLEIPYTEHLGGDIELPEESVAGTKVVWQSSNEDVLTSTGNLNIDNLSAGSVTLTATVTKGDAWAERKFEISLKDPHDVNWSATTQSVADSAHPIAVQEGNFEVIFQVTPHANKTNAVIGFGDSNAVAQAFTDFPMIVRFSPEGIIDVYHGQDYQAQEQLVYQSGVQYTVRLIASLAEKSYSVYVTPEGGNEILLAKDYQFRQTAPAVDKIDMVYVPTATTGDNLFTITQINCAPLTKDSTMRMNLYDEYNLLFGQYTSDRVYLPQYGDNGILQWISSDNTVMNNDGNAMLENGIAEVRFYGMPASGVEELSPLGILYYMRLVDTTDGADSILTREQAAQLLMALEYGCSLEF